MTYRFMIDCKHANFPRVSFTGCQLAGGYATGTPDVRWTSGDWGHVTGMGLIPVTIDQGFTGSPVPTANVRDAEPGAWGVADAIDTHGWTAARPTLYAARSDMLAAVELGWRGDMWLSWPQPTPPTRAFVLAAYPELQQANLVAVQYAENVDGIYDKSVVYDPYWPGRPPTPAPPGWTESIVQDLPTLAQGATGNDVRTAQGLLAARGHPAEPGTPSLGIDGIFGPATDATVRSVQQGWGLMVDGVIGPKTWAKLLNR